MSLFSPDASAQRKGDRPYKGDITGRKFKTKRSPRPDWGSGIAKPNPYAGRKRTSEASRAKANRQTPRYSAQQREKAWGGRTRRYDSKRITFTGKRRYMRGSALSISRDPERPRKIRRITPRSASGAYRIRKRKNPYIFRERSLWEDAYRGDITGRKFRPKRTTDRPGIKKPPQVNYTDPGRRGDKPYKGRIGIGFNSISRNKERAGKATGRMPGRSVRTTFTGKRKYLQTSGLSISRDPERGRRIKRIVPRSASGAYRVRKRKNPYVFRERSPWEEAFQGDITGRRFSTKRTTDRPGIKKPPQVNYTHKGRRGDMPYRGRIQAGYKSISHTRRERAWKNDISGNRLRIRTSKRPDFSGAQFKPYGKRRLRGDQPYRGKIKGGEYRSVSSREERAGKKMFASRPPGEGTLRGGRFQGNIRSFKPLKGGGSISGKRWNNNGRAIQGRGPRRQDLRIAGFQGDVKGGKLLSGGGSVSRNNWNNNGRPIEGRGPRTQDISIGRFQGSIKGSKRLKGGGSISGRHWNNNGRAIAGRGPRRQDSYIAGFQGNLKAGKPISGGGSISRNNWNNGGRPIQGRGLRKQDDLVAKFQGNVKRRPDVASDNSRKAARYSGNIPAYMIESGPDRRLRYSGNIKRRTAYVKNPNAAGASLKVRAPAENDRKRGNYRGKIPAYMLKKGPADYHRYTGNIKQFEYRQNPNAASEALKVRRPGKNERLSANFQGFIKGGPDRRRNKLAADGSLKKIYPSKDHFSGGEYQGDIKRTGQFRRNPHSADGALKTKIPAGGAVKGMAFQGRMKRPWNYKRNPNSAGESLKVRPPSNATARGMTYEGRIKVTSSYKKRPNSVSGALRGVGPSRAAIQASSYQGNLKMRKKRIEDRHPDFKYLSSRSNGKAEKDKFFSFKLFWSRLFRKEENQPDHLKEKERSPRYDKREQGLWYD